VPRDNIDNPIKKSYYKSISLIIIIIIITIIEIKIIIIKIITSKFIIPDEVESIVENTKWA
jgi:hypothetical protein